MQYTIVNGSKAADVIQGVNERLKDGWKLHGYLGFPQCRKDGDLYAQAMVKDDDSVSTGSLLTFCHTQ
jgi:hypothetical protein